MAAQLQYNQWFTLSGEAARQNQTSQTKKALGQLAQKNAGTVGHSEADVNEINSLTCPTSCGTCGQLSVP